MTPKCTRPKKGTSGTYRAIARAILAGDVEAADTMGAAPVRHEVPKKVGVNENSMVLSRYSSELAISQAKECRC